MHKGNQNKDKKLFNNNSSLNNFIRAEGFNTPPNRRFELAAGLLIIND